MVGTLAQNHNPLVRGSSPWFATNIHADRGGFGGCISFRKTGRVLLADFLR